MCSAVAVRHVKAEQAVTKSPSQSEGDARRAGSSMMRVVGSLYGRMGPRQYVHPQPAAILAQISAISIISPLHQRRQTVRILRGLDKAKSRARSLCRSRLFPTCLAASVRAGIWNMA